MFLSAPYFVPISIPLSLGSYRRWIFYTNYCLKGKFAGTPHPLYVSWDVSLHDRRFWDSWFILLLQRSGAFVCNSGDPGLNDPWVGKIPWKREWIPNSVFLPGEFHGRRSLAGYNPWGWKELDTMQKWFNSVLISMPLYRPVHYFHQGVLVEGRDITVESRPPCSWN